MNDMQINLIKYMSSSFFKDYLQVMMKDYSTDRIECLIKYPGLNSNEGNFLLIY